MEKTGHLYFGPTQPEPSLFGLFSTLAAIVDKINKTYAKHIVTIEDPVEFVHQHNTATFSHREVGLHTQSFENALGAAIRQDADVILVGEMRERDTISLAITAAEMGMLVFGTLHTNNAAKTIDRIIDAFPADEQNMIRLSLSESLAGIVSQQLLRTADGKGRIAANEILLKTQGLPNVIREANNQMLYSIIQSGKSQGMRAMDDVLFQFAKDGKVTARDAYMKATDKQKFEPLLDQAAGLTLSFSLRPGGRGGRALACPRAGRDLRSPRLHSPGRRSGELKQREARYFADP